MSFLSKVELKKRLQDKIEIAYDMCTDTRIKHALCDGELLSSIEKSIINLSPEEIILFIKDLDWKDQILGGSDIASLTYKEVLSD